MYITREEAETLKRGDIVHFANIRTGVMTRARVSGKMKVWKRSGFWLLPMKHGMRDSFYMGNHPIYCGWKGYCALNPEVLKAYIAMERIAK